MLADFYNWVISLGIHNVYADRLSYQRWGSGANLPNVFYYEYDHLNKLLKGSTTSGISMSEVLTYDHMGNIKTLSRDNGTAGTYEYLE